MAEERRRTGLIIGALVLAAVAVVGVVTWITGSWPDQLAFEDESEPVAQEESFADDIVVSPAPTADPARITPEAVVAVQGTPTPAIAGVSATAETGPVENMLLVAGLLSLFGFGASFLLAKFA